MIGNFLMLTVLGGAFDNTYIGICWYTHLATIIISVEYMTLYIHCHKI